MVSVYNTHNTMIASIHVTIKHITEKALHISAGNSWRTSVAAAHVAHTLRFCLRVFSFPSKIYAKHEVDEGNYLPDCKPFPFEAVHL